MWCFVPLNLDTVHKQQIHLLNHNCCLFRRACQHCNEWMWRRPEERRFIDKIWPYSIQLTSNKEQSCYQNSSFMILLNFKLQTCLFIFCTLLINNYNLPYTYSIQRNVLRQCLIQQNKPYSGNDSHLGDNQRRQLSELQLYHIQLHTSFT